MANVIMRKVIKTSKWDGRLHYLTSSSGGIGQSQKISSNFRTDIQDMKMTKFVFCLLFSLSFFKGFSQKVYFIYLQTEGEQAFYVKMDAKVHSSSASGYLILSKLRDSTYSFTVGFPQNKWPEQNFSVAINKKDHGYLLKNFGEKGWGLFDLQTLAVQMATSGSAKVETKKMEENKDVSRFADLLSRASDDPSLKEKPAQTSVQSKNETVVQEMVINQDNKEKSNDSSAIKPVEIVEQPVIKKEELQVNKQEQHEVLTQEIVNPVLEQFKPSIITKRSESSTTEGFGLVFIDDIGNGINDTIRLLIPNPKTSLTFIKEEPKPEKKFIDILPDTVKKKKSRQLIPIFS